MGDLIERGAVKIIEVSGVSDKSFDDAFAQTVAKSAESISGITGVDVINMNARVTDGKVTQYRAACKPEFGVKWPSSREGARPLTVAPASGAEGFFPLPGMIIVPRSSRRLEPAGPRPEPSR